MSIPLEPTERIEPPPDPNSEEPAWTVGAFVGVVGAIITTVLAFGLNLTPAQSGALMGLATLLAPLISAYFTRQRVYAPATVAKMLRDQAGP